jgi:thiaminase/transcriptional activator TenA
MSETEIRIPEFAAACYDAAESAWEASHAHPFVQALIDGSLDADRFRFYQMQDARYLEGFADACSILSTRFTDPGDKLWFIDAARLAIVVERELHEGYGERLGYTADDIAALELTPDTRAYVNHMLTCARHGSLLEGVAALVPCPWLYTDVGQRLVLGNPDIPEDHPFAEWLETYADPGFVTYTNELLAILQRLAESHGSEWRERAVRAFTTSVKYEWKFWEQAWTRQEWPV